MPFPCGKCQGEIAVSCVVGLISHERQNISGQYCQLMICHAANYKISPCLGSRMTEQKHSSNYPTVHHQHLYMRKENIILYKLFDHKKKLARLTVICFFLIIECHLPKPHTRAPCSILWLCVLQIARLHC